MTLLLGVVTNAKRRNIRPHPLMTLGVGIENRINLCQGLYYNPCLTASSFPNVAALP